MTHASPPLLNAIQHPLPIYQHCTLQEIIVLGGCVLIISLISLPLLTDLLLNSAWVGIVIALPLSFGITRLIIGKLAPLKQGKPYGFYQQQCRAGLAKTGIYRSPYIVYIGRWSV